MLMFDNCIMNLTSNLNLNSRSYNIDFLGFRCYVGLWTFVILMVISVTNLSFLVKYITRFTEELFALLIAIIFIAESIEKLFKIFKSQPFSQNPQYYAAQMHEANSSCFRCFSTNASAYNESFESIFSEKEVFLFILRRAF
jgi:hypothetical protein